MKTKQVVALVVAALHLSLASVSLADAEREEKPRFKGVELYSWQDAENKWTFVMLDGTNRLKSPEEIKKAKGRLKGVASLKQAFGLLAEDERVSWLHPVEGFEFPPKAAQEELATAAKEAEIELTVAKGEEEQEKEPR